MDADPAAVSVCGGEGVSKRTGSQLTEREREILCPVPPMLGGRVNLMVIGTRCCRQATQLVGGR